MGFLTTTTMPSETVAPIIDQVETSISQLEEVTTKTLSALDTYIQTKLLPNLFQLLFYLAMAIAVYVIGKKLIKWTLKILHKFFERSTLDDGASDFLMSVIKILLNFILVVIVGGILGLETSSVVALIGSAGLAIGLALQGSLSNFAGGVLILILKPFKLGDYIISGTNEGTVTKIDIYSTRLLTPDNRMIVLPNGTLSNSNITNVTNEPIRRLDLVVPVGYNADIQVVRNLLVDVAKRCDRVLKDHDIDVFLTTFSASSVDMSFRVWVNTEEYWSVKFEMQEMVKKALDEANITIPFNQLDVNIIHNES